MRQVLFLVVLLSAPAAAWADDVAAARDHYERGTKAYDLGHYVDAVQEYEAAYNAKPDAAILYNLGQAYRLAGDLPNAVRSYKSFLRRVPDAENRGEVEARIHDLQTQIDSEAVAKKHAAEAVPVQPLPAVAPPLATPTPAVIAGNSSAGRSKRIAGLVVGGFGVGTLIGGIVSGVLAKNAGDELSQINDMMQHFDPGKERAGRTDQTVAIVCFSVGAVGVITGGALFAVGLREKRSRAPGSLAGANRGAF